MSYDIIKSISIKNNQVFVTSASSNVVPKTYSPFHCTSLTEILVGEGRAALDRELFKEFRNGNFQGMSTHYAKAIAWQKMENIECDDGELLAKFKKEWNKADACSARFNGYIITSMRKRGFRYSYNENCVPKHFNNLTQAKYYLRGHDNITLESCLLPELKKAS